MRLDSLFDGKYKILRLLGAGGSGRVYLAENVRLRSLWAIKEVPFSESSLPQIELEIDVLKRIRHSSLPMIVDVVAGDAAVYIVEEYMEGRTLEQLASGGGRGSGNGEGGGGRDDGEGRGVGEAEAVRWGVGICGVMEFLHSRKPNPIIHRDLKPSNIIVGSDGAVRLVDFGSARKFKEGGTQDTVYIGTRGYAAPEQYGLGQTSARSDVYSFGVTMLHVLTGARPQAPGASQAYGGPCGARPRGVSEALWAVLNKCAAIAPGDRYGDFREVREALLGAAPYSCNGLRALQPAGVADEDPTSTMALGNASLADAGTAGSGAAFAKAAAGGMAAGAPHLAAAQSSEWAPIGARPAGTRQGAAGLPNRDAATNPGAPSNHSTPPNPGAAPQGAAGGWQSAMPPAMPPPLFLESMVLSVMLSHEFAFELAFCLSASLGLHALLLNLDFECPCPAALPAGAGLGEAESSSLLVEGNSLRRAVDAAYAQYCGLGAAQPPGAPMLVGVPLPAVACAFAQAGAGLPEGMGILEQGDVAPVGDIQAKLAGGNGAFLRYFLAALSAGAQVIVVLAGKSVLSPVAAACLRHSHHVLYPAKPNAAGITGFNATAALAESLGVMPADKMKFVAWDYSGGEAPCAELALRLRGPSLIGSVRGSKKRDAARCRAGGRPYAAAMERGVRNDYRGIIGALGIDGPLAAARRRFA
ncbi:MAG: serine/threonine protein kinase [Clostridiales bacterium]|jgi:hypothetical protein|nr:serine/threonine protein kinase [Clostridiales bacterium]